MRGADARTAKARRLASLLRDAGVPVETVDAGGYTHAEVNRLIGAPGEDVVTPALVDLVESCGA